MRHSFAAAALAASAALAGPAGAADLAALRWQARPIVVFAPAPDDPRLADQLARLEADRAELAERRNRVIVDTEPGSALRARFAPDGFAVILVGLDGGEKFRAGAPVDPDVLHALVDAMPMRRQEMRTGGNGGQGLTRTP